MPEWARDLVQRRGFLRQGPQNCVDVYCADVRGDTLLLSLLAPAPPSLKRRQSAEFSVIDGSGILRVRGSLLGAQAVKINGVPHDVLLLATDADSVQHVNRRTAFRVSLTLKGEIAFFPPEELSELTPDGAGRPLAAQRHLEHLAKTVAQRKRPCLLRDLSVGGARVATQPPAGTPNHQVLLDVMLSPEEILRNLPGRVVQGTPRGGAGEFCALTRLRFDALPGKVEIRLSRLINEVQLESLRRGVRDRG